MMTSWLVTAMLWVAALQPAARPLVAGAPVRATLAGGETDLYVIQIPSGYAGRITVHQDGLDVSLTLRPDGEALERGLDMRAGPAGDERAYVPISSTATTWRVLIKPILPRATRGDYVVTLDMELANDTAQALATAHATYQRASDDAWGGDAVSFERAKPEYAAAAAAALAAGDSALAAEATYQLARVHDVLGDQPGAIELQRRALDLFRAVGYRDREARVLNRLGDLSRKVGEVVESENFFTQALPVAREVSDATNVADILNNSGLLLIGLGRVEEAIERLQSAIPLAKEVNSANVEGALWLNVGDAYSRLGVLDKAIEAFERSLDVVLRLNLPRRHARGYSALANAYLEAGNRPAADLAIARALALYRQSGDRAGLAVTLAFQGEMLHDANENDAAIALFAEALPVLRELQNRAVESEVLTTWARIDVDRGDADAALRKTGDAVKLAQLVANPSAEQAARYVRALALREKGRIDEAIESIAAVTRGVEAMRGSMRRSEFQTSYLARVRDYFDLQIDLLQQKKDLAGAFEVAERSRARTLLDGLAESAAKIRKGVDPSLLSRQRTVQAQLNAKENYRAQVALNQGAGSARAAAVGRDIDRLLDELNQLRASIKTASPAYAQLQSPEPVTLDRVQRTLLDEDTALIEYHLGSVRSYAWVVDRGSVTVHELATAKKIEEVARPYHEILSRDIEALTAAERDARARQLDSLGRRLAAMVWTPVQPRVTRKRVLIVADSVLQYVPFAALPAASNEPLIAKHEVVHLPSASVLESMRQRSRPIPASVTAAVFADPVFSKNDDRFGAQRDTAAPATARASDGGEYGRLRFSRREAESIAAVSPGVFQALDFTASKRTLEVRDLRRFRILHFATHGSLNAEHPELSGLVLSLVDSAGKPTDGFLRLHEIYNLDLNADLVVLSACRTALGREVHGEGLIGLTRGFMFAGASRVVSSVWNVDDRASAQLMERFYTALLSQRLPAAAALREAQLSLLRQPRWSDPHYWAAFGLQGDWK